MYLLKNETTGLTEVLIDQTSKQLLPALVLQASTHKGGLVGFDIETDDVNRHAGLNKFMSVDPSSEDYSNTRKLVFDINRTTIDGFSLYFDGDNKVYYVNLNHADQDLTLDWADVLPLLTTIKENCTWVIHNFSFEQTMTMMCHEFDLGQNYIDTLQLAVSAYNDDEYDIQKLADTGLAAIQPLLWEINQQFAQVDGSDLNMAQQDVLNKFIGKQSDAAHSYNGIVKSISYGYGLKKAVKSFFGYEQTSFKDALNGKAHMGLVTGKEILHYGADDSYWAVRLFHALKDFVIKTNPKLFKVFIEQENPMPYIWSECWRRGWRVNHDAIYSQQTRERENYVIHLGELAEAVGKLSFTEAPSHRMVASQPWYVGKQGDNYKRYRDKINFFLEAYHESSTDVEKVMSVTGAVSIKWADDAGFSLPKKELEKRGNINHYMVIRTILHDLCNLPFHYTNGVIKTDAESRGALMAKVEGLNEVKPWLKESKRYNIQFEDAAEHLEWAEAQASSFEIGPVKDVLEALNKLAFIETRIKLYINPYLMLTDPETHRMYPIVSGLLNTRRLAARDPNTMQLSKRGESTYVRGFFLPERDDHLIVSIDWSQVELVLIGEHSKDPAFFEAYGQIPYNDLHVGAAASAIQVKHPDFTVQNLLAMRNLTDQEIAEFGFRFPAALLNPIKNTQMTPADAYKFWRGEAGKTSNFGYWYSGSLMTVQGKLKWTLDEMWAGTENYRRSFPVAEEWRLDTIRTAQKNGVVDIFDGHRRTRFEATHQWQGLMTHMFNNFGSEAVAQFGQIAIKKIARRAGNQCVNAKIQGGCATLAKRSILRLWNIIRNEGWDAFFIMPIHDELVFSVHRDQAVAFSQRIKEVMCDHPDLVSWLKLDSTISIGVTLEPFHADKARFGQIELDEAPAIEGVVPPEAVKRALSPEQRQAVVDYLRPKPKQAA